jgi:hypothetical protein
MAALIARALNESRRLLDRYGGERSDLLTVASQA